MRETTIAIPVPSGSLGIKLIGRLQLGSSKAKLVATDGALGDTFGASVGIFEDTVIIGSPKDARSGNSMGVAYIFVRNGNSWTYQSKLMASDAAAYDEFGTSVG